MTDLRKLLEECREELQVVASYADDPETNTGLRLTARAYSKLIARIDAALAEPDGWIPVGERLPAPLVDQAEEGIVYAVIKVNRHGVKFTDAAKWQQDTGYEYWWSPDPRPHFTITHWMNLPKPQRGETMSVKFPSDAYVVVETWGDCKVCGQHRDLRMGACFKCASQVDGRPIDGGHELWDARNPSNRWIVKGH